MSSPSGFTGKERDGETGLDYFGARYYGGSQGRFTSPDPFNIVMGAENREQFDAYLTNPQNWNHFACGLNNPLRYIDPSGLNPISVDDCKKDSACTIVKVNVILDTNAQIYDSAGNLKQEYQEKLAAQLAEAADEYGNANIAFEVQPYTSAAVDSTWKGEQGAINLVVTDSRESFSNTSWVGPSGGSYVRLNIGTSITNTVAHEIAHHLAGDTRASFVVPGISNALSDVKNDMGRWELRNWNTLSGTALRIINPSLYVQRWEMHRNARRWYGGL